MPLINFLWTICQYVLKWKFDDDIDYFSVEVSLFFTSRVLEPTLAVAYVQQSGCSSTGICKATSNVQSVAIAGGVGPTDTSQL